MPATLISLFARYGYLLIFGAVLLENAGVPSPGHTVMLGGGALAQQGHLSLPLVIATGALAAILGDNIGYLIGRRGGRALLLKSGTPAQITPKVDRVLQVTAAASGRGHPSKCAICFLEARAIGNRTLLWSFTQHGGRELALQAPRRAARSRKQRATTSRAGNSMILPTNWKLRPTGSMPKAMNRQRRRRPPELDWGRFRSC